MNLVIDVGEGVARAVLQSSLSSAGPLEMEVHAAMAEPRRRYRRGFASMLEVAARPVAWDAFVRWAKSDNLNPVGIPRGKAVRSDRILVLAVKVAREMDRLANHPAYQGCAVLGVSSVVLPAWRMSDAKPDCAPTPGRAMRQAGWGYNDPEAGVLRPRPLLVRGRRYTIWDFEPVNPAVPHDVG